MARDSTIAAPTVDRTDPQRPHQHGIGLGVIAYLGGAATVLTSSVGALVRGTDHDESLLAGVTHQVDRLIGLSWAVVALIHVGMGSFLAMQAYYGATFVDGIGPVVGVGLIRNLAPLLAGFLAVILVSVVYVADLQGQPPGPERRHAVAVRVLGAMVAGPLLGAWAALVGVIAGWVVGRKMMGVTEPMFFDPLLEMLWARDIIGLVFKGMIFAGGGAVIACHEAIRPTRADEPPGQMAAVSRCACRAALLGSVALTGVNAAWFMFVYHAGPAFGPTLLMPPGQ